MLDFIASGEEQALPQQKNFDFTETSLPACDALTCGIAFLILLFINSTEGNYLSLKHWPAA